MSENKTDPRFYELRNAALWDRETALKLIESDPDIVGIKNSIGETALHFLAVENALEAVEFLAYHNASVNTVNIFRDSVITDAAKLGHTDMVKLLLRLGAIPEFREKSKIQKRRGKSWMLYRRSYTCPLSGDRRQGLRPDHYRALQRLSESMSSRFFGRAIKLLGASHRHILRKTDPTVFFESPLIPRPDGDLTFYFKKRRTPKQRK